MISELFLKDLSLWGCVWQSTLFAVIGLVGSFLLRRRPARACQVLFLAMVAAVLVPTMSVLVKHFELGMFVAEPIARQLETRDMSIATLYGESAVLPTPESQPEVHEGVTDFEGSSGGAGIPWRTTVLCGWMIAALILLGRLVVAFVSGVLLLRRAQFRGCEQIQRAADSARAKLGITKDLQVRSSKDVHSPVIWCWGPTPVLLVPDDLNHRIDWVGVICHELAHWRRRDHISGLIAELIVCVLSWNPLLWWSKKRMVRLSEQACDDWVVAGGRPCEDYAQSLLNFKPQKQAAFVPAVVHSKRGLAGRVRRILKDSRCNPRTGVIWAVAMSIVAACLAIGVACAQTRPTKPASAPAQKKITAAPTAKDKATATAALFRAIETRNTARMKSAVAQGADIEAKDNRGYTPLHAAARRPAGQTKMIRFLLEAGANPNARDPEGQIPLHASAQDWQTEEVRVLIFGGSNVNTTDKEGRTPAMIAFGLGRTEMFDLMIAHGATVPADFMAAYKGDASQVQNIIEKGKAQGTFEQGLTLLHAAAAGGHTTIVELLLTNGLDVRSETQGGYTALHHAAADNHREVAELLLAKGADINAGTGRPTPLHWAVREGHKDMVEWLLARGANPNSAKDGRTPLLWAVWIWDTDIAELVMSYGGDINLQTQSYPWSPLYDAVWGVDPAMAEALVTKAQDKRAAQWAPFHATVASWDRQATEDLLAKGADVNVKGERGWSAIHIAAAKGGKDIAEMLIEKGADVNASAGSDRWEGVWDEGRTPLHMSCMNGEKAVAELLIAKGAEVNAKTKNGSTALSLSKDRGYIEIVELLRKHGAKE